MTSKDTKEIASFFNLQELFVTYFTNASYKTYIFLQDNNIHNDNLFLITSYDKQKNQNQFYLTPKIEKNIDTESSSKIIFPLFVYKQHHTKTLNINTSLITKISQKLMLVFLQDEPPEGNTCFAQNQEVRDDFKTYFTAIHLLDYIFAVLNDTAHYQDENIHSIPFPNIFDFWIIVKKGERLRNNQYV